MARFPSQEWFAAYKELINANDAHREAAHDWEGDLVYVIEADPDRNVPEDVWAWMDLWHGECRDTKIVTIDEGERARFVIHGSYVRWKQVIRGQLDPVKGMMQGKLKLKGDLPTIVRNVRAANELVTIASHVPTEFPDE